MKKRFICLVLILASFVFVLSSCGNDEEDEEKKQIKIVTTIFPEYDFVRQITKGVSDVDLQMLTPCGVDLHTFEPTPQQIISVKDADLFVYVGGQKDKGVAKILNSINKKEDSKISLKRVIAGKDKSVDEHVWTSLLNCKKIVNTISERLCKIDPDNAEKYKENTKNYVKEIEALHEKAKKIVENRKRDYIVFGDKFAFSHFVKDYGLKYHSVFSSCSSDAEANAKQVAEVINQIKENEVPLILQSEQNEDAKIAQLVAKETGARIKTFYSCHVCFKEDFEKGKTYLDFVRENLKTLKEALS